ncbi:hypothetical protein [Thioclava sp. GXIMD4215]
MSRAIFTDTSLRRGCAAMIAQNPATLFQRVEPLEAVVNTVAGASGGRKAPAPILKQAAVMKGAK